MAAVEPLQRLAASLVVVRASGQLSDAQRRYPQWELANAELQRLLAAGVGGVILLGGSATELRLRCAQLGRWGGQPLLLCADVEEGVGQRFPGASWLVPPLGLGMLHSRDRQRALHLAERYGRCTGREARALGLNWVLAPVCDVNNNPANPVINVRAWAEQPAAAAELVAAFCRGLQAEGVLGCAKHFPGHGDTSSDSHLELPLLPHDRQRLEAIELPPFRAAIAAGVATVMTAHLLLPALDPQRPATLSAAVLTGLLRQELGFNGLVVTDALMMEAISANYGPGEAAVLALEAGADLVLMPADADAAIAALVAAVQGGRLSRERLEASAQRRRTALERLPIDPLEPLQPIEAIEPLEPDNALALELIEACGIRRSHGVLGGEMVGPGLGNGPGLNLVRLDDSLAAPFLPSDAPALALAERAGYRSLLLDRRSPSPWSDNPQAPLDLARLDLAGLNLAEPQLAKREALPVLLQLFVRGNPFRGSAGGGEPWAAVVEQLQRAKRLAGLVVYGSPYLWQELEPLLDVATPAVYCLGQMPLAQTWALQSLGLGLSDGPMDRRAGEFTD
ncbi:MAG TPA: glycosyl hydrolase family 3 [Synechococcales bacterium UBA10510]|nr:glycosyl hydrolase family 3 [Synechococcales bacterium UBA10510]